MGCLFPWLLRGILHMWGVAVPLYPRSCWLHSLPSPSPEVVTTLASSSVKGGGEGWEQPPSLAWWVEWGGSRGRDTVFSLLVSRNLPLPSALAPLLMSSQLRI